jgi:hypothetical protein
VYEFGLASGGYGCGTGASFLKPGSSGAMPGRATPKIVRLIAGSAVVAGDCAGGAITGVAAGCAVTGAPGAAVAGAANGESPIIVRPWR